MPESWIVGFNTNGDVKVIMRFLKFSLLEVNIASIEVIDWVFIVEVQSSIEVIQGFIILLQLVLSKSSVVKAH
jgi:hypothetical protein